MFWIKARQKENEQFAEHEQLKDHPLMKSVRQRQTCRKSTVAPEQSSPAP
jgi:hypothetical protein